MRNLHTELDVIVIEHKQKQEKQKEACGMETNISNLLDPEEVLTEDDLIDISKIDIDITKNCTDACIDDPDCEAKRAQRIEGRKKIMQAQYHNAKVKIQNRMCKTKKEERQEKKKSKPKHKTNSKKFYLIISIYIYIFMYNYILGFIQEFGNLAI